MAIVGCGSGVAGLPVCSAFPLESLVWQRWTGEVRSGGPIPAVNSRCQAAGT